MHCRWYPSMSCRYPEDGIPACLAGGIPACLIGIQGGLQAHTQWKVEGYSLGVSRTHWGVSRPTPGEVFRPTPEGGVFRPTPRVVSQHALRQTPPPPADGYCCRQHAFYWNALLSGNSSTSVGARVILKRS